MKGLQPQYQELPIGMSPRVSHPDGMAYRVIRDADTLVLSKTDGTPPSRWRLRRPTERLTLEWMGPGPDAPAPSEWLAALESAFNAYPEHSSLDLVAPVERAEALLRSGTLLAHHDDGRLTAYADLVWQQARLWLPMPATQAFPLRYGLTRDRRHPLRPPKPSGTVYRRHIAWLDRTLSFRLATPEQDLEHFNRWMNDPVVAEFWQEEGDLAKHHAHLEGIAADPHVIGLIGCFDDEPFGYFEVYWAKEDRIAPFYEVDDFDRGWHVLIGEARFRGKPFVTAWLPAISHYLFLDDCRTQRLVIEPRVDNHKMIRNLLRCGYANLKEFDFPHKRAMLGMLLRERFFSERLWVPHGTPGVHSSESLS
jgi:RimJ/RimL family protein N-acetyltransferase